MANTYLLIDNATGAPLWTTRDIAVYQLSQGTHRNPTTEEVDKYVNDLGGNKGLAQYVGSITKKPEPSMTPSPKKLLYLQTKFDSASKNNEYWRDQQVAFGNKVGASYSNVVTGEIKPSRPLTQDEKWEWEKIVNGAKQTYAQMVETDKEIKGEKAVGYPGYTPSYTRPKKWTPEKFDITPELPHVEPAGWNPAQGKTIKETLPDGTTIIRDEKGDVVPPAGKPPGVTLAQTSGTTELNRATTNLVNPTGNLATPRAGWTRSTSGIAPAILTSSGKVKKQKRRSVVNNYLPFDGFGLRG